MGNIISQQLAFSAFICALILSDFRTFHIGSMIADASSIEMQSDIILSSDADHLSQEDRNNNMDNDNAPLLDTQVDSMLEVETDQPQKSSNTEIENALPASLAKAVLIGAQKRSQEIDSDHINDDASMHSEESISSDVNTEDDLSHNSKPSLTGCVWGSAGCNKGKWNAAGKSGTSINSSLHDGAEKLDYSAENDAPSTSVFAGSATAKIKAHVEEAKGGGASPSRRTPRSSISNKQNAAKRSDTRNGEDKTKGRSKSEDNHKPPQGFQLTARIVTSPSDGLSYFLDPPEDSKALEIENWMMTIPYTYVDCGPTVESTTESFLLEDMVVRHFPYGAKMGHWANLAGGVTIDKSKSETGEKEMNSESFTSDYIDGHPKLLVALSPIEITVSGNDEETRMFYPGEVVLMEDTLGKGHKMRAAKLNSEDQSTVRGQDLKVMMISLPHSVHYSLSDQNDYARHQKSKVSPVDGIHSNTPSEHPSPSTYYGARYSIFGFAHKRDNKGRKNYRTATLNKEHTKPCPLEYDSAYSSIFTPSYHQRRRRKGRRRTRQIKESAFSPDYPPPPGHSTYDEESVLLRFLPSLRRTMLFGVGLSLTSSFVYCVQLLYPPLLALIGGAAFIMGGALINVLGTRWSYRQWLAVWEEEWRWRREMKRHKDKEKENIESQIDDHDVTMSTHTHAKTDRIDELLTEDEII